MSKLFMLIRTDGVWPPGGYPFTDSVTGASYKDAQTTFANRIAQVITARKANQRLVSDPRMLEIPFVAVEISQQICGPGKLNGDRRWCTDGSPPGRASRVSAAAPTTTSMACKFCGKATVTASVCKTCGGGKVTYSCSSCRRNWR